ncbi:hypothetical protein BDW62DRAFT_177428 [Aspergillus aurantiobrunneus]
MSLVPIICTHEVSHITLAHILSKAYQFSTDIDSPPTLLLLTTSNPCDLRQYTCDSVTNPPVGKFHSPFLGWRLARIAKFLEKNTEGTVVNAVTFLVADEQTLEDEDTLLLVHNAENSRQTIRLSAAFVNAEAASVDVGCTDVGELRSLADEDGVYRGDD